MREHIQFDYLYDNQFDELKDAELMNSRLGVVAQVEPYLGKYYSVEYVRRNILRQTDQEIIEIDEQIEDEIEKGILPDPAELEGIGADGQPTNLGDVPQDDEVDGSTTEVPTGGEI